MAVEVFMPKAGMDMKEGKIMRWLKNVGERVEEGEGLLSIETDKVTMEVESPASGTLLCTYFKDGAVVPVVTVIGYIGKEGEAVPEGPTQAGGDAKAADNAAVSASPIKAVPSASAEKAEKAAAQGYIPASAYAKKLSREHGIPLDAVVPTGALGEVKARDIEKKLAETERETAVSATPLAKKIAADKEIDVSALSGSGYQGKILKADVLGAASKEAKAPSREAAAEDYRLEKLGGMRKVIAERMLRAHTEIPSATLNMTADVTDLLALREKINAKREKTNRISINDFIIKAVAKALETNRNILVSLDGDFIVHKENTINIGMAVATDTGLIVPVIRSVDTMGLEAVSKRAKDLAKRAREGRLSMDEYKDSTFTVTNLGMYDVESFSPIINQPDSGILGICAVKDELVLTDGQVSVRKKLGLSFTHDHRVIDGAPAAVFLKAVKDLLEDPLSIMI